MEKNRIYEKLLVDFYQASEKYYEGNYFPAPFVPHTMSNYEYSIRKIFYIGCETNDWLDLNDFITCAKEKRLSDYISLSSEWLNEYGFLGYNKNAAYGFWTFVTKCHLALKGIDDSFKVDNSLSSKYKNMLSDLGWGNLNAIEGEKSLKKNGYWENLDQEKYKKIKDLSKPLDRLKNIIDEFEPDYLIIACLGEVDKENAFWELETECDKLDYLGDKFNVYKLKNYKTEIIWTVHPNNLRFNGFVIDDMVKPIVKYING